MEFTESRGRVILLGAIDSEVVARMMATYVKKGFGELVLKAATCQEGGDGDIGT